MTLFPRWFPALAIFIGSVSISHAQVGFISGPANSLFSCTATAAGTPELRPEGYTELLGDILISCAGGPTFTVGANIPTTNLIVYVEPSAPVTSRILGSSGNYASEAMLIIDEAGSGLGTGATGGYGPQAPQTLCTTAQQMVNGGCPAAVGLDTSGNYQVAVIPTTTTPAANVYPGTLGEYGINTVTFYNVPVLPPAYQGVSRTFRITNIRIPLADGSINGSVYVFISANPDQALPVSETELQVGVVGPATAASVNASPAGGGTFTNCAPVTGPTLSSRVTFTEGFATAFKTRVVPGGASNDIPHGSIGNTTYAGEAQNLASASNQNIPGGFYGGFAANNESGFIFPAASFTDPVSNITYTAGLADYGTRLKAVFYNIPSGVTVYVSTTSMGASPPIPGGTSVTPYAVLVATSQGNEATGDGTSFAPLTSAVVGSDGLYAYALAPDNSGATAAVWEVVNSNPSAIDNLTFSVYLVDTSPNFSLNPMTVSLSYSPEPGGGTFSTVNASYGLDSPVPRFVVINDFGGTFATISACPLDSIGDVPINFYYTMNGTIPNPVSEAVAAGVAITVNVTTNSGGSWLSASIAAGVLSVSVSPASLAANTTPYTGTVQLSAPGKPTVAIPVTLTVYPPSQYVITKSHTGNFSGGQTATYSIVVSNASATTPATSSVTVAESPSGGLSLVSLTGTGWNCNTLPTCTRSDGLAAGGMYPTITATLSVANDAISPQVNAAILTSPGLLTATVYDTAIITGVCTVTQDTIVTVNDVQYMIGEALGQNPPTNDMNFDGVVNAADVQIVINALLNGICIV